MKAIQSIIALSGVGVLFSGFLTVTKLLSGSCPLTEGCPYFLGYPSCLWGLLMFGVILVAAYLSSRSSGREQVQSYHTVIRFVSGFGILFSGYFSANELLYPSCLVAPCTYSLILPSCVYGFVMYALIAYLAWTQLKK